MSPSHPPPRHVHIRETLRRRVLSGAYPPGGRIPSEPALAREFGVSRGTVERAIRALVEEGLLVRAQGRGTFVASSLLESACFRLSTFAEEARRQGWQPSTRLLRAHITPADREAAAALKLAPGTPLIEIVRLHHADGEPIVHEVRQLAHTLCPNLLDEDLEHASLHTLLLCTYRIPLVRVRFTVRAVILSTATARLLNVPPGTPAFAVERVTYRTATLPAVRMVQQWRGDRFAFSEEIIGLREPLEEQPLEDRAATERR